MILIELYNADFIKIKQNERKIWTARDQTREIIRFHYFQIIRENQKVLRTKTWA